MEMARRSVAAVAVFVLAATVFGGYGVRAQVHLMHHVVGGDRGWEPSNTIHDWSSGRAFRVGDTIWFAYSAAQDYIVELGSLEEYESCDLVNPIRMYTDGLDKIPLDGEGIRYFASGNIDNCQKGLKLLVNVQPPETNRAEGSLMGVEYGPPPSYAPAESPIINGQSETKEAQQSPYSTEGENGHKHWVSVLRQSWEKKQPKISINGPEDAQAQSKENGPPIKVVQKKWAQSLSAEAPNGPTSHSAPISLSGLYRLLFVALLVHVISYCV